MLTFFGVADGVADGMPLQITKWVIEFDHGVIPKTTNFLVEVSTSRLDPAPSATVSATYDNSLAIGTPQRILAGCIANHFLISRIEDYLVTPVLGSAAGLIGAIALLHAFVTRPSYVKPNGFGSPSK